MRPVRYQEKIIPQLSIYIHSRMKKDANWLGLTEDGSAARLVLDHFWPRTLLMAAAV